MKFFIKLCPRRQCESPSHQLAYGDLKLRSRRAGEKTLVKI